MEKTNTMKLVEIKFQSDIMALLRDDYTLKKMSIEDLAEKYELSPTTVHKWLKKFNIPRRKLTFI